MNRWCHATAIHLILLLYTLTTQNTYYQITIVGSTLWIDLSREQKQNYLTKITSNEIKFGVGFSALTGARDDSEIQIKGNKISGSSLFLLDYEYATHFWIPDKNGCMGTIESQKNGIDLGELKTIDKTRSICELILNCWLVIRFFFLL